VAPKDDFLLHFLQDNAVEILTGAKYTRGQQKDVVFSFLILLPLTDVEYLVTWAENDAVAQLLLVLHVEDVLEGEVQEGVVVLPHLHVWLT
jgi:hypothetical protein